jgi:hypothetical protein
MPEAKRRAPARLFVCSPLDRKCTPAAAPSAALRQLGEIAKKLAAEHGVVTVAAFRNPPRIGRDVAVEVVECFDRIKFTRRPANGHALLRSAAETFGP